VRRIVASDADPQQRLEELLADRRKEIDEQSARLADAVRDLERREQLLRDSRAALERLLRLGTTDLESREAELVQLMRDVAAQEERVRADEAELSRRREELGAVELKRAAVERRERAVAEREAALAERETLAQTAAAQEALVEVDSSVLAFVPGVSYRLREIGTTRIRTGDTVVIEDDEYLVARMGRSPLPDDRRRCAYLVRPPSVRQPADDASD
jgi:hypothetical protein